MKINRPPYYFRFFAYLSRNIAIVRFFRKVLARLFDIQFDRYIRGNGYIDFIVLEKNTKIFLWLDEHVDIIIWWEGCYEKTPSLAFRNLVKPGDRVIDVGANMGYYSLIAAEIVGESGRVFSFEPVTKIFSRLALNVFGLNNVEIFKAGCGQKEDSVKIYVANDLCSSGSRISAPIDNQDLVTEEIKIIRLDEKLAGEKINVVKIDVEGYELNVLKGMEKILRANPQIKIFIEINRKLLSMSGSTPEEVFEYIKSFNLSPWKTINNKGSLQLVASDEYWADENLILFANRERLPKELIL